MCAGFPTRLALAFACCCGFSQTQADVVLLPSAANYSDGELTLTVGSIANLDIFVSSAGGTLVDAMNLMLEIHDNAGLATTPTSPAIGAIALTDAGFLFDNGNGNNDVGSGSTQREIDVDVNTAVNIPAAGKQLASIQIDASNAVTAPGTYTLRFDIAGGSAVTNDPTTDTHFVLAGSRIFPQINIGSDEFPNPVSLATGITINVIAVPEPSPVLLLGITGMLGYGYRRLYP